MNEPDPETLPVESSWKILVLDAERGRSLSSVMMTALVVGSDFGKVNLYNVVWFVTVISALIFDTSVSAKYPGWASTDPLIWGIALFEKSHRVKLSLGHPEDGNMGKFPNEVTPPVPEHN